MKKIILTVCAAVLVLTAGSAFAAPQMQFLGSLGFGYYNNSDAKDFLDKNRKDWPGRKVKDNQVGAGFTAEYRYFFSECCGAGLSLGYYQPYTGSLEAATIIGYDVITAKNECKLTAVPVMANVYYRLNSGENFWLFGAGLGFVHGKLHGEETIKKNETITDGSKGDYTQNVFGCQLMAEYDWVYESGFTLFLGLKGRYADFSKMKDGKYQLGFDASFTGGELYFGAGYSM